MRRFIGILNSKTRYLKETVVKFIEFFKDIHIERKFYSIEEGNITITSIKSRKVWNKAFEKMHKRGDDKLLINDIFADENFYKYSS